MYSEKEFQEILVRLRSNDPTLTTLNLWNKQINTQRLQELANALKDNKTLTTLNLGENQIGTRGVEIIFRALRDNRTLTTIDLRYNQIGARGAEAIAATLRHNTTLTSISLNTVSSSAKETLNEIDNLLERNLIAPGLKRTVAMKEALPLIEELSYVAADYDHDTLKEREKRNKEVALKQQLREEELPAQKLKEWLSEAETEVEVKDQFQTQAEMEAALSLRDNQSVVTQKNSFLIRAKSLFGKTPKVIGTDPELEVGKEASMQTLRAEDIVALEVVKEIEAKEVRAALQQSQIESRTPSVNPGKPVALQTQDKGKEISIGTPFKR